MLNLLDRYILSRLRTHRLTAMTRLLYRLRARRLAWRLSDMPRRVDIGVRSDEGVRRARRRVYAARTGR